MKTTEMPIMTLNPDWCFSETSATQAARIITEINVGIRKRGEASMVGVSSQTSIRIAGPKVVSLTQRGSCPQL
jgi:hypothetical protein